jgi:hypothetical protein
MKVKMIGTAIINTVEGKDKKRKSKEFTTGYEYDVSEKEFKEIKQSCVKAGKYKNKQMTTD